MAKLWNKKNGYLLGGILVSIVFIYGISFLTVIKPMKLEADTLRREAAIFEKQYKKIINQSSEEVDNTNLITAGLMVPSQKSPDILLLNLQDIADSTNVSIDYIGSALQEKEQPDAENSSSNLNEGLYSLDASAASLSEMNQFLEGILESKRLVMIDAINLQQNEEQIFLTITFKVFYKG